MNYTPPDRPHTLTADECQNQNSEEVLRAELECIGDQIRTYQNSLPPQKDNVVVKRKVFEAYEAFRLKGGENALMAVARGIVTEEQLVYIMGHYSTLSELYNK